MENNSLSGAMLGVALSNAMNDKVFRTVLGYALLNNEKKLDDGVGMALLMNNNPTVIQPSTYRTNY